MEVFWVIGLPPVIIHLQMDLPWNKPSILRNPHDYGNHQMINDDDDDDADDDDYY